MVLEYAQLFGPTMKESVKQLTKRGFHYFTPSSSFHELPEGGSLHFTDIPMIPQLPTKNMSIADQKVLCDWHDIYGQPVVQVTIRNQTTKDYIGDLNVAMDPDLDCLGGNNVVKDSVKCVDFSQ